VTTTLNEIELADRWGMSPKTLHRWRIRFDPARFNPDLTVAIRLDAANAAELDYYLLPKLDLPEQEIRVSNRNSANFECFRFDNLNFFYGMSERERLHRFQHR
jgi:transposase-like protein